VLSLAAFLASLEQVMVSAGERSRNTASQPIVTADLSTYYKFVYLRPGATALWKRSTGGRSCCFSA
jgi:hypothetical protein